MPHFIFFFYITSSHRLIYFDISIAKHSHPRMYPYKEALLELNRWRKCGENPQDYTVLYQKNGHCITKISVNIFRSTTVMSFVLRQVLIILRIIFVSDSFSDILVSMRLCSVLFYLCRPAVFRLPVRSVQL